MINRWILGIFSIFALAYSLSSTDLQAAQLDAYLVVKWEGRELSEPNLESFDAIRKKNPDVSVIHLINPTYFKDNPKSASNLEAIKKRIVDGDEVGLYFLPSASLVKAADVIPVRKPTFWGYGEELCAKDCGQEVPVTVYNRSDVSKLFWAAHAAIKDAGFNPTTYAVHGWIAPAGLSEVAQSLGYTNDITAIDFRLVKDQLKEYPVAEWLKAAPAPVSTPGVSAWTQAGGAMEFSEDADLVKRFDQFFGQDHDRQAIFALSVSQESFFLTRLRLENTIAGMKAKAESGSDELVFKTISDGKRSRPIAEKVVKSKKL
jgi:hypothetical protein